MKCHVSQGDDETTTGMIPFRHVWKIDRNLIRNASVFLVITKPKPAEKKLIAFR